MSSKLVIVRNAVLAAVKDAQANGVWDEFAGAKVPLAVPGVTSKASYIPLSKITDPVTQAGRIWVIGTGVDDGDRQTRRDPTGNLKPLVSRTFMVQVAYQQGNILADDIDQLDKICLLLEQLRDVVKNWDYVDPNLAGFQPLWVRNESLKDENGFPLYFYMLREGNVAEAYFTAHFTIPHQ